MVLAGELGVICWIKVSGRPTVWNQGGSGGDWSRPYTCPLELHSNREAATKKLVDRGREQLQAVLSAVGGREGAEDTSKDKKAAGKGRVGDDLTSCKSRLCKGPVAGREC